MAALYWPSVRRLVPNGYIKHDSLTAEEFAEAGLLKDESPEGLMGETSKDLLFTVRQNIPILRERYGVKAAETEWDGTDWVQGRRARKPSSLGWIHLTKFWPDVLQELLQS